MVHRKLHRRWLVPGLLSCLGLTFAGCERPVIPATVPAPRVTPSPPWFEDVTAKWGLDFTHDPGPVDGEYFLPQINGSGAALFDCDNDGRLDIYLLQGGGDNSTSKNALFRQSPSGKFENVSVGSGLDINGLNTGVAVGDVNNDQLPDVLVTQYLGAKLFLNDGKSAFHDVTKSSHIDNPSWGTSASFLDFDRDGWLDLVIANYVAYDAGRICHLSAGRRDFCPPFNFPGTISVLFRNLGRDETGGWRGYQDVTEHSRLSQAPGAGLGVMCADFNGDHWPDIFVANDGKPNHLWTNQKDGTFVEDALVRGLAYNSNGDLQANMGVVFGDIDNDGLSDLIVTHFFSEYPGVWKQQPLGQFQEQAAEAGLTRSRWRGTGFGAALADFDHDGTLDLAMVNGYVGAREGPTEPFWKGYLDRNQLFANDGQGHFRDISLDNPAFCGVPNVGRGLCMGDIDGDGAIDLLVTQVAGPVRVLRNVAPRRGHWLMVRAIDPKLQRDANGAEIRLVAGSRRWQQLVQPAQSFQCTNDSRAHFGLGNVELVDGVEVLWVDGVTERFPGGAVDRICEVRRGSGRLIPATGETQP